MKVHCFTSASFAYLDRVRVLGASLRRFHPDWTFSLCLCDAEPPGFTFDITQEPIDSVVRIEELGIPDIRAWMFPHNIVELCTAVKGQMLCRLLDSGAEKVIYLDPDIAVFASLDKVTDLLDAHDIVLTRHLVSPQTWQSGIQSEIDSLKHGTYNLGFVAVANRGSGVAYAKWWRDRLMSYCFDDIPNGLFTDQRWCDLVPALFRNVFILRDESFNIASWNLSTRRMVIRDDGTIRVEGDLLRFFHFTKITSVGEASLLYNAEGNTAPIEVMEWYRRQLARCKVEGLPAGWWAFSTFSDGRLIRDDHRRAYRHNQTLQKLLPEPFSAKTDDEALFQTAISEC